MAFTSVKAIVLIQLLALVIGSSSKLSFGEVTENSSLYNHQDNKIISNKVRFSLGRFPKKSPSTPTPVKRPSPSKSPPRPPSPPPPPPAQSSPSPPPSPPPPAQSPPPPPPPDQSPPPPTKSPPPPPPPPAQSPKQTPPPSPTAQKPANQPAPPPSQSSKLPPPLSPPATQLPIGRPPQPSPPATQLPIGRPPPSPPATQLPIRRTPPQSPPTNQPPNKSVPPPPTDYDDPPIEPPVDHEPPIIEPPPVSHEPPFVESPPTSQPPIIPFPSSLSPPFIPGITPPVKLPPPTIHPAGKPLIVVGRVNCKSCSRRGLPSLFKASPLHGASVTLVCHNNGRKANVQTALTDNNGDFYIIPISLARGDVHKCRVYLVKSPKPICTVPTNYNNGKSGAVLKPILLPGNHGPGLVFDFFGVGPFIFEAPNKFSCRK